jgi:lipopolysaccharide export system protein LptA
MLASSSTRFAAAASVLLLLGLSSAMAQSSGSPSTMSGLKLSGDKPIQIESDKLEVHQNENLAIFTGNVSVVQGPTLLKAGRMKVYYVKSDAADGKDKGKKPAAEAGKASAGEAGKAPAAGGVSPMSGGANIDHLEVDGKVYIKSDDQVATGDSGTFDMKSQVLVLSGKKVVLSQGDNVLVGCKLTVQMQTGLAQVDACGGRVMMSLTPQSQNAQ